jgi:hypothetical protein
MALGGTYAGVVAPNCVPITVAIVASGPAAERPAQHFDYIALYESFQGAWMAGF